MSFTTREFADKRRPRWLWPLVGAAVLIVVVALILVFTVGGSQSSPAAQPNATAGPTQITPAPGSAPANPATTGVLAPNDPQYLTAAPAGVNFQVVHGLQLPFSPVDGPLRINGPVAAGYSRTPQGAALAAIQIGFRLLYAPGYQQVVAEQAAVDPALREKFLAARNAQPQMSDTELSAAVARTVAFKFDSFTPERATVEIAGPNVNGAPGTYVTGPYTVVWSSGDWKFTDNSNSPATTVNSLSGYTTW